MTDPQPEKREITDEADGAETDIDPQIPEIPQIAQRKIPDSACVVGGFTQIEKRNAGCFWGSLRQPGLHGGRQCRAFLDGAVLAPPITSGYAGGRLRRAQAQWVCAHLCHL